MTNLTDFPNTTINDYREAYENAMFEHYDMDGRYFDDFMCEHEDTLANYVMNDGRINLVAAVLKFHGNKHRTSITWNDLKGGTTTNETIPDGLRQLNEWGEQSI